jgi:hypothetical protein
MITALTTGVVPEPGQIAEFAFSKYQAAPLSGTGPGVSAGLSLWGGPPAARQQRTQIKVAHTSRISVLRRAHARVWVATISPTCHAINAISRTSLMTSKVMAAIQVEEWSKGSQ